MIGNKNFPINIIQGPLAGTSCSVFRTLLWKYSQPAYVYSEMIACKALILNPKIAQHRFLHKDPQEGPVCFQLVGSEPNDLAEATKIVTDCGADLIDLNCGCSVKKVFNKGEGASVLTDLPKLYRLIQAVKNHTHLPVSVKIRVAIPGDMVSNFELATVITEAGADQLVVHGRHWTEHFNAPVRYEAIQFFVEQMKIPVIGNGDVVDLKSLQQMFATGCAGVMIARAGVGQPWLIKKLVSEMQHEQFIAPSIAQIGAIFFEHVAALAKLLNDERTAVLQARKFARCYARGINHRGRFCAEINECDNLTDCWNLCQKYF